MTSLSESTVESAALAWLETLGWESARGPDIAPDMVGSERDDYDEVVLLGHLHTALTRINPDLPPVSLEEALRKLSRPEGATLESRNHAFHRMLVEGVTVEIRSADGAIRGAQVRLIDFKDPANNDWLAVNQFTVTENKNTRRPDIVLFVNGLPLGVIELKNPTDEDATIVVLTDRNDLDDQLFGTFSRCQDLLRQPPLQAESRADLRRRLSVESGEVVFTTIQKFFLEKKGDTHPTLSRRRNIVVIADEAHRSQYDFIDGFARYMRDALPRASFVGFTGTPIELKDANTRSVFGDYISVYDIQRSVEDGATVAIYYESRLARLALDEIERPRIDPKFEEITEGEEVQRKEKLKTRWAQLEAIARVNRVFKDKPGGLVVDYLGLAHELKRALATYTESGGTGRTAFDQSEAVAVMLEKYEVCCGLFHGFDWSKWIGGTPQERPSLPAAQEHILAVENGKDRCVKSVSELSQAFALAVPHEDAIRIRDDVAFFQAVRSVLSKRSPAEERTQEELDHAVRQIISRAVT